MINPRPHSSNSTSDAAAQDPTPLAPAANASPGIGFAKAAALLAVVGGFFLVASLVGPAGTWAGLGLGREDDRVPGAGRAAPTADAVTDFGQLIGRNHRVVLLPGETVDEARYTIYSDDGELLAENVTAYDAEAIVPGLDLDTLQAGRAVGGVPVPIEPWK